MKLHKNSGPPAPRMSFILLDWGCRERFTTLDWLRQQDVPKDQYELIWVELYDRVVDEVLEKADVVITCNQRGTYHKHIGYNIGLLQARGRSRRIGAGGRGSAEAVVVIARAVAART